MVIPIISFLGNPNLSNVLTQTSKARVESRPPDIPTTTVLQLVWIKRFANPITCISNISSQRWFKASPCGTNGCASIGRVRIKSRWFTNSVPIWISYGSCRHRAHQIKPSFHAVGKTSQHCAFQVCLTPTSGSKTRLEHWQAMADCDWHKQFLADLNSAPTHPLHKL